MEENQQEESPKSGTSPTLIIGIIIIVIIIIGGIYFVNSKKTQKNSQTAMPAEGQMQMQGMKDSQSPTEEVTKTATPTTTDSSKVKSFEVDGSNYKFSPNAITVNEGDTVKITFKNTGGMHNFVIDEFDARTNIIPDGESQTVQFVANKKGTFQFYCSVANHRAMGMVGTLTVN